MLYKHWKKLALALTSFFWAGCDDTASSAVCLYGPDPNYSSPENQESSSSTPEAKPESSSSDSLYMAAQPLYGVTEIIYACNQVEGDSTMQCGDGATCTERTIERWESPSCSEDICPDYGVVQISEKTYECDGKIYNEAEFRSRYEKITIAKEPQDTIIQQEVVLYGPPCVFNDSCDDEKE